MALISHVHIPAKIALNMLYAIICGRPGSRWYRRALSRADQARPTDLRIFPRILIRECTNCKVHVGLVHTDQLISLGRSILIHRIQRGLGEKQLLVRRRSDKWSRKASIASIPEDGFLCRWSAADQPPSISSS
ncbi:hypothetical protein AcV7_000066 [Taiwanofungus camphoratus]|nr:hypothetical protein AcV7_000066 [Antrodia cinnamomea]